ncbi:MAG: hypothetical protein ACYDC2_03715, partial [Solirubrobacteraceae bacterium]
MSARPRKFLLSSLTALAFGAVAAPAFGAEYDVRGTWEAGACVSGTLAACEAKPEYPQKMAIETENFATGALTGYGETTSGAKVATLTGTISGCTVKTHYEQPGYTSDATLTLSADGTKLQGTFSDSYGRVNDPTWASRASGPGCGSTPAEGEPVKEEKKGLRPTGTSVICNYEIATSEDVCGASVGDGGAGAPVTPTGTVKFTATTGGFSSGAACSLVSTPLSPQVASCTVVFFASESKLPTVTAAYGGDAVHSGSTGSTQFLTAGLEEPSLNQSGPSGSYPNELVLETQVPAAGTTVEATVEGHQSRPQPVPLSQPPVTGLDARSANDLGAVEALAMLADLDGLQNASVVKQLNADVEKLDARAVEVSRSASPAEQAEAQHVINETTAEIEALTQMEKQRNEAILSAAHGGGIGGAGPADAKLETADQKIVELLQSPSPTDQARAQHDLEQDSRVFDQLTKQLQKREEVTKELLRGIKASVSRKHRARLELLRTPPLGHLLARNLPAGRQHLALKLNKARLKAATRHRSSLPVLLR